MNTLAKTSGEVEYRQHRSTTIDDAKSPRPLTHDEKKAAEAAFQGMPFNPTWSEAARRVYEGITNALCSRTSS
jgi:hypothetical protein